MSADLTIRQNDTKPYILFTCLDPTGAVVNLTGITSVSFSMRNQATGALITGVATVVGAVAGTVAYHWAAADTSVPGWYNGAFRVIFADASLESFPQDHYLTVYVYPLV